MTVNEATTQLHIMQCLYPHIRKNDAEWAAMELAKEALREKAARENTEQLTNADRIRAMSDEELAKKCLHLMGAERVTVNPAGGGYHTFFGPDGRIVPYADALGAWMNWLRRPAQEG